MAERCVPMSYECRAQWSGDEPAWVSLLRLDELVREHGPDKVSICALRVVHEYEPARSWSEERNVCRWEEVFSPVKRVVRGPMPESMWDVIFRPDGDAAEATMRVTNTHLLVLDTEDRGLGRYRRFVKMTASDASSWMDGMWKKSAFATDEAGRRWRLMGARSVDTSDPDGVGCPDIGGGIWLCRLPECGAAIWTGNSSA